MAFLTSLLTNRIIAIDIGKNVGVSIGQEFKVFPPGYTGKKKFLINDGRTTRTIGVYPKVELTTITVFDVQSEVSFAYISDTEDRLTNVEVGSILEAIPTGSISHLLTGASRYFPVTSDHARIGDSSALRGFVAEHAQDDTKPFAVVFRFVSAQEYLNRYGSAAMNLALARLFRDATNIFHTAAIINILDAESVAMVGRGNTYNERRIVGFVDDLADEYPELRLVAGVFSQKDIESQPKVEHSPLNPDHAIEFARYAASDYAGVSTSRVTHFNYQTAYRMLQALRDANAYTQGLADFNKLREMGVQNADILNVGGLLYSRTRNHAQAADLYEAAYQLDPSNMIYKTNFGTAAYELNEIERGLKVLNSLSYKEIEKCKDIHPYGFVTYARLLAKAKVDGLPEFDAKRFVSVAETALNMADYKDSARSKIIATALAL